MRKTILIILIFHALSSPLFAEKLKIAVLDLKPEGVTSVIAGAVTDVIRAEIVAMDLFTVIEREQMDQILREQEFQMSGCTDNKCAVQAGKLLSAEKIMIGEINKIGPTYIVTIRVVNTEKGTAEMAASETVLSEDDLVGAGKSVSRKITDAMDIRTMSGYYKRCFVPGWGQHYAGSATKGYVFMGLAAGTFLLSGYSAYNYYSAKKEYDELGTTDPPGTFDSRANSASRAATLFNVSLSAFIAVYAANWIDIYFFGDTTRLVASTAPAPGGFYADLGVNRYRTGLQETIVDFRFTLAF